MLQLSVFPETGQKASLIVQTSQISQTKHRTKTETLNNFAFIIMHLPARLHHSLSPQK